MRSFTAFDLPARNARASAASSWYSSRDLLRARSRTALDLIEKAGACAVLVIAVVARAEKEGPLQRVDRAVHRPHAREGAVIIAPAFPRSTMLHDLRRLVIGREEDVRKRLVVPHQHVVAGPELLDEVGLEQQCLHLRRRRDDLHRGRLADHPGDPVRMGLAAGVGTDAALQALGLADIENVVPGIEHAVDARSIGERRPETLDDLCSPSRPPRIDLEIELDVGPGLRRGEVVVLLVVEDVGGTSL